MNLLQETIADIEESEHTPDDIIFIGSETSGHSCTWEEFSLMADQDYDDGYGAQEVAEDLIIVFSDGSKMWRHEYDGSESWLYSTPFKMSKDLKPITRLICDPVKHIGWKTLANLNL